MTDYEKIIKFIKEHTPEKEHKAYQVFFSESLVVGLIITMYINYGLNFTYEDFYSAYCEVHFNNIEPEMGVKSYSIHQAIKELIFPLEKNKDIFSNDHKQYEFMQTLQDRIQYYMILNGDEEE